MRTAPNSGQPADVPFAAQGGHHGNVEPKHTTRSYHHSAHHLRHKSKRTKAEAVLWLSFVET